MQGIHHVTTSRKDSVERRQGIVARERRYFLITVTAFITVIATIYEGHEASSRGRQVSILAERLRQLQQERDDLLQRLAGPSATRTPRLPAPPMQVAAKADASSAEKLQSTNLYARFKDNAPKLSAEQVEAYLKAYGRKA